MTRRGILAGICAIVCAAIPLPLQAYTGLVIFGDSLSDVGNVYSQTFNLEPSSPPYYQGRYSNGPLWVEQLSLAQGLPAVTRSRSSGNDWAYAGTKTGSGSTNYYLFFNFPNIGTQISNYLAAHTPSASDLFVVWGGGNDFIDGQTNASIPVNNIVNHITALKNAGAKNFLVPNLPLLGEVPRFVGTSGEATMNSLSSQFNSQLATALTGLKTSLNVNIFQLDVAGFFADVLGNPGSYGFTNTTGTALVGNTVSPIQDQYVFWDDIHPTRIAHNLLGVTASDLLDTHHWISTSSSGSWSVSGNWDPGGTPQSRWIVDLSNASGSSRTSVVSASSAVRRIDISAASGAMKLQVPTGVTLTSTERIRVAGGGQIELQGGTVATPSLQNLGGTVSGFGTIGGDYQQDHLGSIKLQFPSVPGASADPVTHITGSAMLDGTLGVSLGDGEIALPGETRQVMTFGSYSGDLDVVNETGFAGLSFTKMFTSTSLSLTATALPGDANLDGRVDLRDLVSLATHWFSSADWLGGDFDQNGFVNSADLGLLAMHWQSGASAGLALDEALKSVDLPPTSVPEPSGLLVMSVMLSGAAITRRPRCPDPSPSC